MKLGTGLAAIAAVFSFSIFADDPVWGNWQATGNGCRKETLQILTAGDSVAVLFTEMGVNFPKGQKGEGKLTNKRCAFRVQVTPPPGMYLASMRQTYAGGILKSKKSSAMIHVRYRLGSIRNWEKMAAWKRGVEIGPTSPDSIWAEEFNDTARNPVCREKVAFVLDMNFTAQRDTNDEYIIGNVDSLDAAVTPELALYPNWQPCRRR